MTRIEHDFIGDLEVPQNPKNAYKTIAAKKTKF